MCILRQKNIAALLAHLACPREATDRRSAWLAPRSDSSELRLEVAVQKFADARLILNNRRRRRDALRVGGTALAPTGTVTARVSEKNFEIIPPNGT
jgi:hypothetical protein